MRVVRDAERVFINASSFEKIVFRRLLSAGTTLTLRYHSPDLIFTPCLFKISSEHAFHILTLSSSETKAKST